MFVWGGALGVAVVSGAAVWPLRHLRAWNAIGGVVVPVTLASIVYWTEALASGKDADQFSAWAPGVILMLALPGALVALVIVAVSERRRAGRAQRE
jgi:hypothetical protein